jgi:phosphotransferase system HPr (HPr) family protein
VIQNEVGLHARPAALFVKEANRFKETRIEVAMGDVVRDAKSILGVLTLGVKQGTTIAIRAEGPEAERALKSLSDLVNRDFKE